MAGGRRVQVRRAYDDPEDDDGRRILVDRVWPRGLSRQKAHLDEWCKEVAPSPELRKWYGHDPARREEFAERYRAELADEDHAEALEELRRLCAKGPVTLLTSTHDLALSELPALAAALAG